MVNAAVLTALISGQVLLAEITFLLWQQRVDDLF